MKRMQHLTVLSAQKRKIYMLIKQDSIVKCIHVHNHRQEDSGNKDNRRTNNEDNNDSWKINNSDLSDIGSGYETNDDEEEKIPPGQHAMLANPNAPKDEKMQHLNLQPSVMAQYPPSMTNPRTLTAYFIKQMAEHEQEGEDDSQQDDSTESSENNINTSNWTDATLSASIEKLKAMKEKRKASQAVQNRNDAVKSYLCLVKAGFKRGEASKIIAEGAGRGIYFARSICAWAAMFMNDGQLPISIWGKHAKRLSYLKDEDCILRLQHYLRKNKFKIDISELTARINESILPQLEYAPSPTI
uniref:AlNc14C171G8000 protein n=1 Tax=Albugo laibachii Nc14 TaxID=890382 RepID=F0WNH6_9STRA|nr:AlNc14C171G8000 [Albugo laibachii Nc14]|eukprot:CCA22867.1 AlNc14C171G8000 [Albugo laibachii Nc14]